MEKVLFVCYFFAPQNDTGTFRSVNFVKRLPQRGFQPVVFTTDEPSILKNGGKIDHTIAKDIPVDIEIVRFEDINKSYSFWSKIKLYRLPWTFCFRKHMDIYAGWSRSIVEPAVEKIKIENIKFIYVSCAPVSAAYSAIKIKKKSGASLVVDFRDPYTDAYGSYFPGKFNFNKANSIEREIIEQSDTVVVNTEEVKKLFTRKYPHCKSKFEVITNGY